MTLEHANELFSQFMRDHGHLVDLADAFDPDSTDAQIVTVLCENLEMTKAEVIERLACMDFVRLRWEVLL